MPNVAAPPAGPTRSISSDSTFIAEGTFSRRMDHVGNNVLVTFSNNDEIASRKAKLFGSSAKMDTFTGQDMSRFQEWVAQFLSGVNLYQPSEPHACQVTLHLLMGKATEMAKNIPQHCTMLGSKKNF